jgi:hypothetical protein
MAGAAEPVSRASSALRWSALLPAGGRQARRAPASGDIDTVRTMVVTVGPPPQRDALFGVLWGKSDAGGSVNLLLQHLLDTAAVAELLWDRFLAPTIKNKIDGCCGGRGRSLFALVCGVHDVGKASPAFQAKVPSLASAAQEAGLGWRELDARSRAWHHTLAGAVILRRVLGARTR